MSLLKEMIDTTQGGESLTKLRQTVDEIKKAHISPDKPDEWNSWAEKIRWMNQTVDTHIENDIVVYTENRKIFQTLMQDEDVINEMRKSADFVPRAVFEPLFEAQKAYKKVFTWVSLKSEILDSITKKLFTAINTADYFKVQRLLLEETKQIDATRHTKYMELVNDLLLHNKQQMDENFMSALEENRKANKEQTEEFSKIIFGLQKMMYDNMNKFTQIEREAMSENFNKFKDAFENKPQIPRELIESASAELKQKQREMESFEYVKPAVKPEPKQQQKYASIPSAPPKQKKPVGMTPEELEIEQLKEEMGIIPRKSNNDDIYSDKRYDDDEIQEVSLEEYQKQEERNQRYSDI